MRRTRWNKLLGDIRGSPGRLLMMAAAIGVSLLAIGAVTSAYAILSREISRNYLGTNPASATVKLDRADDELVEQVAALPGIAFAEARASMLVRVRRGNGDWQPSLLFAVRDFAGMRLSKFYPNTGAWPPPDKTMLVERAALPVLGVKEGDSVYVRTPNGIERKVLISGSAHDPGLAPAWQERMGYAYVIPQTLEWLGERNGLTELKVVFSSNRNQSSVTRQALALVQWLCDRGKVVTELQVPPLGKHPHQNQMTALLLLLFLFTLLALMLSAVLAATMVSAIMAREVRSIGIMKTIGGGTVQIAILYICLALAVSAAAIGFGLPLGLIAGRALARAVSELLNFTLVSTAVPAWVFLLEGGAGCVVPLAFCLIPISRASRLTVREAMSEAGITRPRAKASPGLIGSGFLSSRMARTIVLALRNAFRRRGRSILTLGLLAVGGAIFMAALNTDAAWFQTLTASFQTRRYDFEVRSTEPQPARELSRRIAMVPGVKAVEAWGYAPASTAQAGSVEVTQTYPDGGHGSLSLRGVPEGTSMVSFPVIEGRWLKATDMDDIVLNQMARAMFPDTHLGRLLTIASEGHRVTKRLVGIVREIGPAAAYMSEASFETAVGLPGLARSFRVATTGRTAEMRSQTIRGIDRLLDTSAIGVSIVVPQVEFRNAITDHIFILIFSLIAMAVLMGLVGAIGLASAMGTSVVERTREFGVLRAIGATPAVVLRNVVGEGLFIGLSSWIVSLLLSLPLSYLLGTLLGNMSFMVPLLLAVSATGAWVWLLVIVAGSVTASTGPALRASRLTIRETLVCE